VGEQIQHETMPSGKLGEALGYLPTQWPKLVRYVEDPRLTIDTNLAENAIGPLALGRRNWLFAGLQKANAVQDFKALLPFTVVLGYNKDTVRLLHARLS
jgi:transposase